MLLSVDYIKSGPLKLIGQFDGTKSKGGDVLDKKTRVKFFNRNCLFLLVKLCRSVEGR